MLRRCADAAIDGGCFGLLQFGREPDDCVGIDPTGVRHSVRREGREPRSDLLQIIHERQGGRFRRTELEQCMGDAGEEGCVSGRGDGDVFTCPVRGHGAARVKDDGAPPALMHLLHPAKKARCHHHAAIGLSRVGAHDPDKLAAIDIRHIEGKLVAIQKAGHNLPGVLVKACSSKQVGRSQRLRQVFEVSDDVQVMRGGIAHIDAGGLRPMLSQDRTEPTVDEGIGILPAGRLQFAVLAQEWGADAIRIRFKVGDGGTLGADKPA